MEKTVVFLDRSTVPAHIYIRPPEFTHQRVEYMATSDNQIIERAKDADIIITNKVILSDDIIEQLPKLQHIALIATGYNNIDINACQKNDISVSNIRGYATPSVPEHSLVLIFSLRRHILDYQCRVRQGEWQKSPYFHNYRQATQDLAGSQLGIIGGGELGQATAKLALALGMHVVFAERKGKNNTSREMYQPFHQVIQQSDIISLHCPLNDDTRNLITLKEMQAMKSTALLINTARGGLINEHDLVTALNTQQIAGAGLDVVEQEPIRENNPLLSLMDKPNFILTPHIAWTSDQAMQTQADQLTDNIESFVNGKARNLVT